MPWRISLIPLGGACAGCLIGCLPTAALGGQAAVQTMLLAQGLILAVVYSTLLPAMRKMLRTESSTERFRISLKAGAIRFVLTVPLAAIIAWQIGGHAGIFLIWIGIAYLATILLETMTLVYWNRLIEAQS